jgi:phosphoglycolate phosphatase
MSLAAVIFDLDGTLVDSAPDLAAAANALLAEHGLPPLGTAEIAAMVGDGVAKLVERALAARQASGVSLADAVARFMGFYERDPATLTRAYPGVPDGLRRLRVAGIRLGLCTNKPERATRLILDRLDLADYFSAVVTGDSLRARKPDPAPIRLALTQLAAEPGEAVMVGDHVNDVLAAEAAGIRAIFARYGYGSATLGTAAPAAATDHFSDLPTTLRSLGAATLGVS